MTTTLTRRQRRMLDTAAQRGGELVQGSLFDYDALETEARIVVKQRTGEIKTLVRRAAQDIIEIGQKLIEVKEHLEHGQFGAWLKAEFDWSERTARQFMTVADQFKTANFADLNIGASALYLLAAPSTPDAARDEALERAAAGETITHQAARQIVEQHRPPAKAERVADVALPADVVAALDAAAHAAPGTEARRVALAKAVAGVMRLPNGEARGLAMDRYRQLDAEHYAAVGPSVAPVPSVEEADRVAMLASLDYVIDDLTAAGYTVAGWERNTPQGTVYTLRRGADVVRHTLHGLMLMLEATTPKAPPAAPAREALPKLPLALSDWRWESAPSNPGWCLRAPWTGSIVWTTDFFSDPQAAIAQAMRASQLAGRAMLVGAQITGAAGALDRRLVVRHPGGNGGGVYTLDELDQTIEGWVAAKFSAAEARTVAGATAQRAANAHNPAWRAEGDKLARDLQEADDRGVVLTIAALFDGDGDGLPLASPGELADLEAHLVRAARAWAAGWLVKVGEATG